ncbi:MAG: protein kinase [Myxococcales bacterium]|nr:protein kinase [Myxococcales bacterium]
MHVEVKVDTPHVGPSSSHRESLSTRWLRASSRAAERHVRLLEGGLRAELTKLATSFAEVPEETERSSSGDLDAASASISGVVRAGLNAAREGLVQQLRSCTEDSARAAIKSQEWERALTDQLDAFSRFLQFWNRSGAYSHAVRSRIAADGNPSESALQEVVEHHTGFIIRHAEDALSRWIDQVAEQLSHTVVEMEDPSLDPDAVRKTERLTEAQIAQRKEELRRRKQQAEDSMKVVLLEPSPIALPPGDSLLAPAGLDPVSPPAPPHSEDLVGTTIAERYRVMALAARGAVGVVYKAEDLRLNQTVALKMLSAHPTGVDDAQNLPERFRLEASRLAQLSSPFTVRVQDHGEWHGTPYLVLEFVEGVSVAELLQAGPIEVNRAIQIAQQMCHSLGEAHSCGLVHRDLKPANVLVMPSLDDNEVFVKVVDFGLAKELMSTRQMTKMGTLLGTPKFMSPEQAQGRWLDHRSDLYSLGVMMFIMLTGEFPYAVKTPTVTALLLAHVHSQPRALREVAPHLLVPHRLQEAVSWCLVKDPAQRCSSARDLLALLRDCRRDMEVASMASHHSLHGPTRPLPPRESQPPESWYEARESLATIVSGPREGALPPQATTRRIHPSTHGAQDRSWWPSQGRAHSLPVATYPVPSMHPPHSMPGQPPLQSTGSPASERVAQGLFAIAVACTIGCVLGILVGLTSLLLNLQASGDLERILDMLQGVGP